jgi:hypothetical protein
MLNEPNIFAGTLLAESDSTIRIALFAIVIAIWVIVSIVKAIANLMQQVQKRVANAKLTTAAPMPPRPTERRPPPMQQRPPTQGKPGRGRKSKASRALTAGLEPDETHALLQASAPETAHHESGFDTKSIRALMTPAGLRSAYVYAEVLDPPPSVRG